MNLLDVSRSGTPKTPTTGEPMTDRPLESFLVSKLADQEQELLNAHAVLDLKQAPRAVEGRPRLSLAARILALVGELPPVLNPVDDMPPVDEDDRTLY